MNQNNKVLETLSREMRNFIDSAKRVNQWHGIETLLRSLYPDEAHFICELLQNAEDVAATEVSFKLTEGRLIFQHNGSRLFDEDSTRRIVTIGSSFKKDDPCQIGKFGIGFKSVFAYTTRPEIHSGDFDFAIEDMVCPVPIAHLPRGPQDTIFVLPLNRPEKSLEQSTEDLVSFFAKFRGIALLFLKHIRRISWNIDNKCRGFAERRNINENLVAILLSAQPKEHYFLHKISCTAHPELDVCVAYELEGQDDNHHHTPSTFTVREADGKLCIFFPAEKEPTQLKFHIHAPFAPTVDRASIPWGLPENKVLIEDIAQCMASSLTALRERGLLDRHALAVIPLDEDALPEFLEPMLDAIYDAFTQQEVFPLHDGGHAPTPTVYTGPVQIRDVLGTAGLRFFTGNPNAAWGISVLRDEKGHRLERLARDVGVRQWVWGDFELAMDRNFHDPRRYRETGNSSGSAHFLQKQTNAWIASFYILLHELVVNQRKDVHAAEWCVVLATDGSFNWGKDVYLDSLEGLTQELQLKVLDERVLHTVRGGKDEARIRELLRVLGVKDVGLREQVAAILRSYYTQGSHFPLKKLNYEHMELFVKLWRETGDASLFSNYKFFYSYHSKPAGFKASDMYFDIPFRETGLRAWYEITGDRNSLWKEYRSIPNFMDFAAAIGVAQQLRLSPADMTRNNEWPEVRRMFEGKPVRNPLKEDWSIAGLEKVLHSQDAHAVRVLWRFICNLPPEKVYARYQPNKNQEIVGKPAQFLQQLRKANWIPCGDDVWRTPRESTKDDLPDWLPYDNRNKWLDLLQFGHASEERRTERERIRTQAEKINIDPELAEELSGLDVAAQKEFLRDLKRRKQELSTMSTTEVDYRAGIWEAFNAPGSDAVEEDFEEPAPLGDPQRREAKRKAQLDAEKAEEPLPDARYFFHIITKRNGKSEAVRKFLDSEYGGRCQICGETFDKRNRGKYFEAVYLLKLQHAGWLDNPGNALCLCPNHAAKLQHGASSGASIVQEIEALDPSADLENLRVNITLCERAEVLRFTSRHLVDIQTLLRPSVEAATACDAP